MPTTDQIYSDMQLVFLCSRVNGAVYIEADERFFADWPRFTWFQKRLAAVRNQDEGEPHDKS